MTTTETESQIFEILDNTKGLVGCICRAADYEGESAIVDGCLVVIEKLERALELLQGPDMEQGEEEAPEKETPSPGHLTAARKEELRQGWEDFQARLAREKAAQSGDDLEMPHPRTSV